MIINKQEFEISEELEPILKHFGILGMKWGVRRFQNKSGILTPAGRKRLDSTPDNKAVSSKLTKSSTGNSKVEPNKAGKKVIDKVKNITESAKEWDEIAENNAKKGNSKGAATAKKYAEKDRANAKKEIEKQTEIYNDSANEWKEIAAFRKEKGNVKGAAEAEKFADEELAAVSELKKLLKHSDNDAISHFGILGMKWGVRNAPGKGGRKSDSSVEEYKQKKELREKGVQNLTTAELKVLNQRMQLEQQYKDLSSKDVSSGRKVANSALKKMGEKSAEAVAAATVLAISGLIAKKAIPVAKQYLSGLYWAMKGR